MTAFAIGAAMAPPVESLEPGWSSMMTATAILGSLAGANDTDHAWIVPRPVWAVPVLPGTEMPGMRALVPVPRSTTLIIMSRRVCARSDGIAVCHGFGWKVSMILPSLSRIWDIRWGVMITPLLAIPAATSAIWRGVADTSCWPMADLASAGLSRTNACSAGKVDFATAGRSSGGRWLKPKASAPAGSLAPPRSRPMRANVVLHETRSPSFSGPPHDSLLKLARNWLLVLGSGIRVRVGYTGWSGVMPFGNAMADVTTLKVDPGKYASR